MIKNGQQPLNKLYGTTKSNYQSSNGNSTYIIDLDTGESLGLQGLPRSMEYDPKSVYSVIKTPGRNLPFYTFSGSEDVLEFDITWYSVSKDKSDVLARCKWLESMSKADGFLGRNHFARLLWGRLFSKTMWIVESAKYTIRDWDKVNNMFPIHASQKVVLKRYSLTNPTHEVINDIRW